MSSRDGVVDCLIRMKRWNEALEYIDKTLELSKNHFDSLYRKVGVLIDLGRVNESKQVLSLMESKLHPSYGDNLQLFTCKMQVYYRQGSAAEALAFLQQALTYVSLVSDFQIEWKMSLLKNSAPLHLELQQFTQALEACDVTLASPVKVYWNSAKINKAEALYYLGRYSEALAVIKTVTQIDSLCATILKALLLACQACKKASFNMIQTADSLYASGNYTYFDTQFYLAYSGKANDILGQHEKALSLYEKALSMTKSFRLLPQWITECQEKIQQNNSV